jgi:hypothetical protein
MWDTGAGSRLLNQGGGCPNEDLDVRDHRHARCGADVQPSFRPAPRGPNQGIARGETITSSGEVGPGQ